MINPLGLEILSFSLFYMNNYFVSKDVAVEVAVVNRKGPVTRCNCSCNLSCNGVARQIARTIAPCNMLCNGQNCCETSCTNRCKK